MPHARRTLGGSVAVRPPSDLLCNLVELAAQSLEIVPTTPPTHPQPRDQRRSQARPSCPVREIRRGRYLGDTRPRLPRYLADRKMAILQRLSGSIKPLSNQRRNLD